MNYRDIANKIDRQVPEGFKVDSISLNVNEVKAKVPERIYDRITQRFAYEAGYVLNENLTVNINNSLNKKWDYSIVCETCNSNPMYDSSEEEYYCPNCKQKSVFNFT